MWLADASSAGYRAIRRSRRLLALVALVDALICVPLALYVAMVVDRASAHQADADRIAKHLDSDFFADLKMHHAPSFDDNVNALFGESKRLDPSKDTLDFLPGSIGSYPNYFFDLSAEDVPDFFELVQNFDFVVVTVCFGVVRRSSEHEAARRNQVAELVIAQAE